MKKYRNPVPTREAGSNKTVSLEEFHEDMEGYRPELQYSQLQPRNIDPDALRGRKSEGEIMETFQAKSLMGAALDQIAIDQMKMEQGNENAMRIAQIARDTHLHPTHVHYHVSQAAAAPGTAAAVAGLGVHSDAAAAGVDARARHDAHMEAERQVRERERADQHRESIRAQGRGAISLFPIGPEDTGGAAASADPGGSAEAGEPPAPPSAPAADYAPDEADLREQDERLTRERNEAIRADRAQPGWNKAAAAVLRVLGDGTPDNLRRLVRVEAEPPAEPAPARLQADMDSGQIHSAGPLQPAIASHQIEVHRSSSQVATEAIARYDAYLATTTEPPPREVAEDTRSSIMRWGASGTAASRRCTC